MSGERELSDAPSVTRGAVTLLTSKERRVDRAKLCVDDLRHVGRVCVVQRGWTSGCEEGARLKADERRGNVSARSELA